MHFLYIISTPSSPFDTHTHTHTNVFKTEKSVSSNCVWRKLIAFLPSVSLITDSCSSSSRPFEIIFCQCWQDHWCGFLQVIMFRVHGCNIPIVFRRHCLSALIFVLRIIESLSHVPQCSEPYMWVLGHTCPIEPEHVMVSELWPAMDLCLLQPQKEALVHRVALTYRHKN